MSKDLCDTMICSVNFDLHSFHIVNFDLFLKIHLCSYVYLTVNNVWLIQGSLTSRVNFELYSKWFSIKWTLPVSINCPCAVRRILNVLNIVWLIQGSLTSRVNFDQLGTHFICEAHSVTSIMTSDLYLPLQGHIPSHHALLSLPSLQPGPGVTIATHSSSSSL